ncbi:helix-turn-helix domain-containing protein [Streptomyces sp. NPDC021969]|uniref:helix-turn-helix domain-containing protein n=1 Tax=unclassified Streptomyces TaxID=2593676 RepID=UPI0033ED08B6
MGCLGCRPGLDRGRTRTGRPVPTQHDSDSTDGVAEFAALLRELKDHTDRSYGSLARRLGMNTSTLHRYCAGDTVPLDFAPVERFAALCGATPGQRLELHRRWLLAVAARHRPRTAGAGPGAADAAESEAVDDTAHGPDTSGHAITEPDTEPETDGGPAAPPEATSAPRAETDPSPPLRRRPWYRRRPLVAGTACVCAVLATLGALSALPDRQRASADGPAHVPDASASGTARARASERPDAAPSPSSDTTASETSEQSKGPAAPKQQQPDTSRPHGTTTAPSHSEQPAGLPLTWSVNSQAWKLGCGHDYVIAKPPSQVPPPPAPQDAAPWAATQNAVHGKETLVQLSVQGRSDTAVVLEALRVRVTGRAAPVEGNAYAMDQGCGGSITPRSFAVDLDKDRPIARAVAGNDSGTPIPAVRMPYRVSAKDPEVLLVTASASSCDCRWYLELDWSSQGRTGTVRIDDDGRPFRTTAIEGLPRYMYDTLGRQWGAYS